MVVRVRVRDRLAAIKAKYDPGNLSRVNQNIRPVAPSDTPRLASA
jgi:hypothetical protein